MQRPEEYYKRDLIKQIKHNKKIFTKSNNCILCGTNTSYKKSFEKHNKSQKHEKNLMLLEDVNVTNHYFYGNSYNTHVLLFGEHDSLPFDFSI